MNEIEELAETPSLKMDAEGRMVREIRCTRCRAWLADEYIYSGKLILKCFRCKNIERITFKHLRKN